MNVNRENVPYADHFTVAIGMLGTGFGFYGKFGSHDAAIEYAQDEKSDYWEVIPLIADRFTGPDGNTIVVYGSNREPGLLYASGPYLTLDDAVAAEQAHAAHEADLGRQSITYVLKLHPVMK